MNEQWITEDEDEGEPDLYEQNLREHKPKIMLALQDPKLGHGIVYLCGTNMPQTNEGLSELQAVGHWSSGSDYFYVEVTNTIDAMQDTLIRLMVKNRQSRIDSFGSSQVPAIYPGRRPINDDLETARSKLKRTTTRRKDSGSPEVSSSEVGPSEVDKIRNMLFKRRI